MKLRNSKIRKTGMVAALTCSAVLGLCGCSKIESLFGGNAQPLGGGLNPGQGSTASTGSSSESGSAEKPTQSRKEGYVFEKQSNGHYISEDTLDKLDQMAEIINEQYLYANEIDDSAIEDALCQAMMDYLNEPYSCYYDKKSLDKLMENSEGIYCGIGASLLQNVEDMKILVVEVFSNSPAKEVGIQSGDYIVGVGDIDISQMELSEVVTYTRGEEGTSVELEIYRPSTGETFTVDVVRRKVEIDMVEHEMLEDNIGYIAIKEFEEQTYPQFDKALKELMEQGMEHLIVDLRNNPGGMLDSVVDVCGEFVDGRLVVYNEYKDGRRKEYDASKGVTYSGDIVVLTNGNSASASEIMTGCLKDYKLATIMGTTTFGKGIVQAVLGLDGDTAIKLTIADYFTPNGNNIHKVGIEPDIVVEDDKEKDGDEQLEAAKAYLLGQ